ncbi:hypothetical protein Q73_09335 [Bacillus coahuilensis m2-6]|uniref:Sulfatase N-terminal domain-containing protein n=1 Tax=Bacillus coahuilensis p1.1.43 TaxID=1150625 RepID=A0A147K7G0_9BACI|nr:LTA synthase family protein [Bacillus coahuilensis]KUP05975.1 hypothetical protein Q75_09920 [Bacillus coahuilensis p1.1.43]KUP07407.1 hypothetical protein Q73_09335 [Bacillus coahuilensis m2-6]
MSSRKKFIISLPIVATILVWIKTYIVYKTSFSITIENSMQEFILFINPISFLLLIFGVSYFIKTERKRTRYVMVTTIILSIVVYGNVAFYRFFTDFLTLPVLFQTSNFSDLGSSASATIKWTDSLYFLDVVILAGLIKLKPAFLSFESIKRNKRRAYYFASIAILFFNLGLSESERPELLTRTFDREMLVKNIGTFNYHLYDIYLQSKSSAQRALADGSELSEIDNYLAANYVEPNDELFGIAKDKNVIMISLESIQSFVINNDVYGEEVTPFLNDFIKESIYFDNFYHQTAQGKTSDSEFIVDNSLYPLNSGAVFFTHAGNEYHSLTEQLNKHEYYTSSMHANNKSFWNRDLMYDAIGYDYFYSLPDYEVNDENSVNWGLKDIPFFEQSVEHMKEMPQPFFTKMITLTNHYPFTLDEEDKYIDEFDSNSGTLNRYFQTVRYMDEAVKLFIEDLKESGIYDDSIIVMYGDHYGISENHNAAMEQYLGTEVTPYVTTELQKVPFIIHIPGVEAQTISDVSGQIDIRPTLLHLLGIDSKGDLQFGQDLFSPDHEDFLILRDGRFITDEVVFAGEACWDKDSGEPIDKAECDRFSERVKTELDYSDKIIYGDLLRFYGENGIIEDPEYMEE